jgi:hypothetical protein
MPQHYRNKNCVPNGKDRSSVRTCYSTVHKWRTHGRPTATSLLPTSGREGVRLSTADQQEIANTDSFCRQILFHRIFDVITYETNHEMWSQRNNPGARCVRSMTSAYAWRLVTRWRHDPRSCGFRKVAVTFTWNEPKPERFNTFS